MKKCEICGFEHETPLCLRCETKKFKEEYLKQRSEPMPNLLTQAKNLGKAVIKHVANGMQTAPKHVVDSRLKICSSCQYLNEDRCSKCGCFVEMKASITRINLSKRNTRANCLGVTCSWNCKFNIISRWALSCTC